MTGHPFGVRFETKGDLIDSGLHSGIGGFTIFRCRDPEGSWGEVLVTNTSQYKNVDRGSTIVYSGVDQPGRPNASQPDDGPNGEFRALVAHNQQHPDSLKYVRVIRRMIGGFYFDGHYAPTNAVKTVVDGLRGEKWRFTLVQKDGEPPIPPERRVGARESRKRPATCSHGPADPKQQKITSLFSARSVPRVESVDNIC